MNDDLIARAETWLSEVRAYGADRGDAVAASRELVPGLVARLKESEAENERHRKANLVRAVTAGYGERDEWVTEIANTEFDRIPWRVAERLGARVRELEEALRAYGQHKRSCRWRAERIEAGPAGATYSAPGPGCTCGFRAALREDEG